MAVGLGASSLESSMTLAATMNVPRYRFSWPGALLTRFSSLPVGPTLCLILLSSGLVCHSVWADDSATQLPSQIRVIELPPSLVSTSSPLAIAKPLAAIHHSGRANFGDEPASPDARHVADWVVDSGNNGRRPFAIVDKVAAKVFVFNAQGDLRGAAPVLLGLARGDDTVPGIGQRKLSAILPEERTTPAGRFVASLDRDVHGQEVLWVDYDSAISMHPVITSDPKERRQQRLDSPLLTERRISYGCINVPVKFYTSVVSPAFKGTDGIVYVLPETRPVRDAFASYDIDWPASSKTHGAN